MNKVAITAQGVEQIMRDTIRVGNRFGALQLAIIWWRSRCRETQALLDEAVKTSLAQARNFVAMKARAESAEAKLQAAEEALRGFGIICPINKELCIPSVCSAKHICSRRPVPSGHIGDTTQMVTDRERRLEEALSVYARDESRFLGGEGEPFGSIPTEIGAFARSVWCDFELRLLGEKSR